MSRSLSVTVTLVRELAGAAALDPPERQHGNDLAGRRFDDHDLIAHDEKAVSAVLRSDFDDVGRERLQMKVARNNGADRQREIHVVHGLYVQAGDGLHYPRSLLIVDVHRRVDAC